MRVELVADAPPVVDVLRHRIRELLLVVRLAFSNAAAAAAAAADGKVAGEVGEFDAGQPMRGRRRGDEASEETSELRRAAAATSLKLVQ